MAPLNQTKTTPNLVKAVIPSERAKQRLDLKRISNPALRLWMARAAVLALGLWLVNRLLDGLDGTLARRSGRQSERGAYADILADVIVYAAIPLGIAAGQDDRAAWIAAGALLATAVAAATPATPATPVRVRAPSTCRPS